MNADYFLTLANQTMWVLALAAAPILLPVLVSGLVIGMVQAATSINEATLSFVPKLIVVAFSILIFGSLILGLLSDFTVGMFERIPDLVR
jgi:flagellar biosynthetic protein FliQ